MSCTRRVSWIPSFQSQHRGACFSTTRAAAHCYWCSTGHSRLQGNQVTVAWIYMIWCIYKIYKHIKHNRQFRDCFVPFSNTESENTAHISAEKHSYRTSGNILMPDLSFSPLGAMQITTGCEIFALVINSLHPFCTRTILPTLPSMSVFINDYLAHCVLKNTNFTLNIFPENKIQSCLTCYAFKFPTAASVSHCLPH